MRKVSEERFQQREMTPDAQLASRSRKRVSRARRPDITHNYLVSVLTKASNIMRLLEQAEQPMNVQQVCDATSYPKTTVYRILRILSAYGYVPQGDVGVYKIESTKTTPRIKSQR